MKAKIKRLFKGLAQTLPGLFILFVAILLYIYYPKITSYVYKNIDITNVDYAETTEAPTETTHTPFIRIDETAKDQPFKLPAGNMHSTFKKIEPQLSKDKESQIIKNRERKARKKINYKSSVPYKVKINRVENFVMIYGINIHGKYKIPYKCFVCSTAKKMKNTLLGHYRLNGRYRWHSMVDGSYAQYAIRFYDTLMLHSVPYYEQKPNTLETDEYNKLGSSASLGCVRMRVSDIKWIYKHCKPGTEITIYDKKGEKPPVPYEKPQKLNKKNSKSCWDPTDPNKKNPWNK